MLQDGRLARAVPSPSPSPRGLIFTHISLTYMYRSLYLGIVLELACLAFFSQAEAAGVYRIDPAQSELVVQLFKAGVGSALAHDHVVRATKYTGQIQVDPTAPTIAAITVEVQAASLTADEPAVRQKYGLPTALSEKD